MRSAGTGSGLREAPGVPVDLCAWVCLGETRAGHGGGRPPRAVSAPTAGCGLPARQGELHTALDVTGRREGHDAVEIAQKRVELALLLHLVA